MASFWAGKSVFLTGHTGFKGGWLALWLNRLGAEVHGFATDPPTTPSLFAAARVNRSLATDTRADLRDFQALEKSVVLSSPQVIFHLASQPLVRRSYREPVETFTTNVLGTAHVLEAARKAKRLQAAVVITTDKVYENKERPEPYREDEPLGGHDPYSASKAAAEIVTASYRSSFFGTGNPGAAQAAVATARAGNVIGGGDWAEDRLIPDCIRSFAAGKSVELRYPDAVRPWQHVLEPLSGYLALAEALAGPGSAEYRGAFNFGPAAEGDATVGEVARLAAESWGNGQVTLAPAGDKPHEAGLLRLDISKARRMLGWNPRWPIAKALETTLAWYKAYQGGQDMHAFTLAQIDAFSREAA